MDALQQIPQPDMEGRIVDLSPHTFQHTKPLLKAPVEESTTCTEVTVNTTSGTILNRTTVPLIERRKVPPRTLHTPPTSSPRVADIAAIQREIQPGSVAWLHGYSGCGLSMLLHQVVSSSVAESFVDGVTYVDGEAEPPFLYDIMQRLFKRFYTSDIPIHLPVHLSHMYFGQLQSLMVLDHLPLAQHQLAELTDIFADSTILVAADNPAPDTFLDLPVGGLSSHDAIALTASEADLDLTDLSVAMAVYRICTALHNLPLPLLLVGRLVKSGTMSLQRVLDVLDELTGVKTMVLSALVYDMDVVHERETLVVDTHNRKTEAIVTTNSVWEPLDLAAQIILMSLNRDERLVLAALVRVGGYDADLAALTATSLLPMATIKKATLRLMQLGVLEGQNGRYAVPSMNLLRIFDYILPPGSERSHAAAYFAMAIEPRSADLIWLGRERTNVMAAIETSLAEGAAAQAVVLIRAIHPFLVLRGLWGSWGQVIQWAEQAAHMLRDTALRAWALHERGTHAALHGDFQNAVADLGQAYYLRYDLDDRAGANATRYNLHHFGMIGPVAAYRSKPTAPATPTSPNQLSRAMVVALVIIAVLVITVGIGALAIAFGITNGFSII
ncbi:MAG: hypothetical protein GFH27_549291n130 [Chloroflexi bacterium AL-W]|nr:hypothetical protein [Chloroflexi bacterium AL-N1]NOK67403.1 hypothetical protein [Chloroflexi bacterium AL-N10]NOK75105.1 hypothetical protein [Chloroflexi bacterium AL-N5]NOK81892.1 hypothetical protein [Chloroflexi bacterium AL-W]NOK89738.1 hypothetical protein [Chloroflexi bacterium AL-N15]